VNYNPASGGAMRPKAAAQYLAIGESTLWLRVKTGDLAPIKLSSRTTVFLKADLDSFLQRKREEAAAAKEAA
jgi:predicted DNA-binding transcriptional regulator AlpA